MKDPKVDWPSEAETGNILDAMSMSKSEVEKLVGESVARAEVMAKRGVDFIAPILCGDRDTWESAWNTNSTLTKWFGKVTHANHVKDVHRRMEDAHHRFADNVQKVKVRAELPHDYDAQNLGGAFSPNTFKVAVEWMNMTLDKRAAVMIHESQHAWFLDQKIDGQTVYGSELAQELARKDPGSARRSPENYEQYCLELQAARGAQ